MEGRKVILKRIEAEKNSSFVTRNLRHDAKRYGSISHPNIVQFLGVTWIDGTDFAIVVEHMKQGTLNAVLSDSEVVKSFQSRLQMCLDVVGALVFLHGNSQYVRRLTSREVFVGAGGECKVNLLEIAPISDTVVETPIVFGAGELAWTAPELVLRDRTEQDVRKSNVFAMGVLMCEILTGVSPYASAVDKVGNTLADIELFARIKKKAPLAPHENSSLYNSLVLGLRDMISQCLSNEPRTRPSAEEIQRVLVKYNEDSTKT
ncbi:hypothetical protein P43SY_011895 [Pythium insidiosum]|uniref:Protein kinase domain-containing protein n=1 Tax=Pythium insidiosum TaxID=114742 RepID=A0AAD5LQ79_PYTIN|nr:hypothetical protein P43SY_011895 [Pythium insidiosum]